MIKKNKTQIFVNSDFLPLSVIVASHNEEEYLENCLRSILNNNYPKEYFEVILVDDRSNDKTFEIVNKLQSEFLNLKYIKIENVESGFTPKKNALNVGINNANYNYFCLTDADCIVENNWLQNIANAFKNNYDAVIGYSPYLNEKNNLPKLLSNFLDYEEYKNSLYAFSGVEFKNAFLCNGRNFAYSKNIFNKVGGFDKIKNYLSGDDDLLLQLFSNQKAKICSITDTSSFVYTYKPKSIKQFINQRKRHFSVSGLYNLSIKLFYLGAHILNLSIIFLLIINLNFGIGMLIVKLLIDFIFCKINSDNYNFKQNVLLCSLNEILLILYYFVFGMITIPLIIKNKSPINWN